MSILVKPENSAAIGRFFYDPPLKPAQEINAAGLHVLNNSFYTRYRQYLKHPLSQIASLEIARTGDATLPPLYVTLGFDSTWADSGILGWYLTMTERPRDVTSYAIKTDNGVETKQVFATAPISTHGCRIFMEYTAASKAVAVTRRLDAQGRSYRSLLISSGDKVVPATAVHGVVMWLLKRANIEGVATDFKSSQFTAAEKIAGLLRKQENEPITANSRQLKQAHADHEKIGFKQMHRNFPVTKPWETTDNQTAIATILI